LCGLRARMGGDAGVGGLRGAAAVRVRAFAGGVAVGPERIHCLVFGQQWLTVWFCGPGYVQLGHWCLCCKKKEMESAALRFNDLLGRGAYW